MQQKSQTQLSISGFFAAAVLGLVAAFGTAVAATWSGLSGSLWSTVAPAIVVGLLAFFVALWRMRAGDSATQIWQSVKELWHESGNSAL